MPLLMGYFTDYFVAFEGHNHPYKRNILKLHTISPQAALAEEPRGPIQNAIASMSSTAGMPEKSTA